MNIKVAIITVSDKCASGEREDRSGELLQQQVQAKGLEVVLYKVVPDEMDRLVPQLRSIADEGSVDLILTTGGTGFSKRDITPEATKQVIEKEVPGLPQMIRAESAKITSRAYLSRGIAGISGSTLIVNLPGSPKAVKESLEIIYPILDHGLEVLRGSVDECGSFVNPSS